MTAWLGRLDDAVEARPLVPLRIAVGPLVLLHLAPFLERAASGLIYRDRFWLPYADWYPHLPRGLYVALLWSAVVAGFLISVGLLTRIAAWWCAAAIGYNLFLSQTHYHHNRGFLLILLVGVAVLPVGGRFSLDRVLHVPRVLTTGAGRRLAMEVLRLEVALVYVASGVSKLIDPDWWGGTVTRLRVVAGQERLGWLSDTMVDLLLDPGFHAWAAKAIVLTELFIGLGLLWRRTRNAAVWVAIPFHLAIEATAAVQVFTWAALAALVIWVTPSAHDRTVTVRRSWATVIRVLDWTGRFSVAEADGPIVVVDRDGTVRRAGTGARFVASRLPLTFPIAAPLALLRDRRRA